MRSDIFLKFYPEPPVNQGSLPPEEADGPLQFWKDLHNHFFVVAVNETGLPNTDSPFTQADATDITARLTVPGYQLSIPTIRYCRARGHATRNHSIRQNE